MTSAGDNHTYYNSSRVLIVLTYFNLRQTSVYIVFMKYDWFNLDRWRHKLARQEHKNCEMTENYHTDWWICRLYQFRLLFGIQWMHFIYQIAQSCFLKTN